MASRGDRKRPSEVKVRVFETPSSSYRRSTRYAAGALTAAAAEPDEPWPEAVGIRHSVVLARVAESARALAVRTQLPVGDTGIQTQQLEHFGCSSLGIQSST